jgi:3-isopropylmalate/(R)-2-methylmalate dehydratase small subunit
MMQPVRVHRGTMVPLHRRDIDTDQIIPKQFLKSIERTGFGEHLFHDWRFGADGTPDASFVLNDVRYSGASILIAGENFGCGSSREHAAWALLQYGFRVVIAPSFADIFRANAITNGLVPVALPPGIVTGLATRAASDPASSLTVDLEKRRVTGDGVGESFPLEDAARHRLLHGLDDIGVILQHEAAIARYEAGGRVGRGSPQGVQGVQGLFRAEVS